MMKSLLLFSAAASATLAAGVLGAQGTPPKADSTCTKYSDGRVECRVYRRGLDSTFRTFAFKRDSTLEKRAALGLELRSTGTKRDTLGVFVEAVTPKGPAENAGIVEGDRIAAINSVDLRTASADAEDSYASGLASHRLTREVQKLTPGTRVTLRVYSGGRFRDVQVTAGKASEVMRLSGRFNFRMPMEGMMEFGGPEMMKFAPEMMMRERMPMLKERLEPLLRERMRDLPNRIQLRTMPRIKTSVPVRGRTYRVDNGGGEWTAAEESQITTDRGETESLLDDVWDFDEPVFLDNEPDLEPFILDLEQPIEFENEIEPVSPEAIRELAATAARDARFALERLAAAGIV
ncbi:MAG TPA: PDZ domain-containing protein [Gemmatimonadaceae bacterium]|nr:PDZ domain-containing protein [Gemmatimonadaceae bacterium]